MSQVYRVEVGIRGRVETYYEPRPLSDEDTRHLEGHGCAVVCEAVDVGAEIERLDAAAEDADRESARLVGASSSTHYAAARWAHLRTLADDVRAAAEGRGSLTGRGSA